jgi:tetratricopeptide (TPR) repeat protein
MLRIGRMILLMLAAQLLFVAPPAAVAQSSTDHAKDTSAKPDLARAKALILAGKGAEAWAMLEPYEFQLAGQPDYDYLLGVAAIAAGHPARATLALERVLAVNPNHAAARLDMGRAYFALGDYDRARTELKDVLAHDPPPAARDTIERYLNAIEARTHRAGAPRVTGYAEASIGYDSNVNAGVAQNSLFLPLFGATFTLAPSVTRQDDNFASLGGGIDLALPVGDAWSLVGGADAQQRSNSKLETFDYRNVGARVGVQHAAEDAVTRVTAGTNQYDLDNVAYRRMQSLNVEWRRRYDRRTQFTLYGQDLRLRYVQPATRSESSNMVIIGVGGVRTLDEATRSFAFGNLFAGDDGATDQRIDGSRRLYGVRVGMQRELRSNADWYATLGLQHSKYLQENPIFALTRKDWQYDVALGVNWRLNDVWSLRPQLTYTRNDATTPINDYDRSVLVVTLRRDWR